MESSLRKVFSFKGDQHQPLLAKAINQLEKITCTDQFCSNCIIFIWQANSMLQVNVDLPNINSIDGHIMQTLIYNAHNATNITFASHCCQHLIDETKHKMPRYMELSICITSRIARQ